ncbi:hypothetical protein LDENG_00005150 [Lucifuga dentata]|nr:hypothetical protein LDENG_00005150 [Lucifuga dentata]
MTRLQPRRPIRLRKGDEPSAPASYFSLCSDRGTHWQSCDGGIVELRVRSVHSEHFCCCMAGLKGKSGTNSRITWINLKLPPRFHWDYIHDKEGFDSVESDWCVDICWLEVLDCQAVSSKLT